MPTPQQPEQPRSSTQTPAIQPRPSKSPEIQRPLSQAPVQNSASISHPPEFERKADPPRQDSGWSVPSTQHPSEQSTSSQNYQNQTVKEKHSPPQFRGNNNSWKPLVSQQNSLSPPLSQPPPHQPSLVQQGYQHLNPRPPQQIFKNENGSALSPVNRLAPAPASVPDNANQADDKTASKDNTIIVNGVVGDQDQGTAEMAKENERTKMAFLLN